MTQPSLGGIVGVEILPGLIFRMLNETDWPQMSDLIASNYSFQHPISQTFNLSEEDIKDKDLQAAKQTLMCNGCFGVFDKQTGQLVAFARKKIHDVSEKGVNPASRGLSPAVTRFLSFVLGDAFADLNTSRYTFLSMACVKAEYRTRGIITAMLDYDMRQRQGGEYMVAIPSSVFTQRTLKRLGFKVLREVKYADYVDPETGLKPDLKLSPIHTSCQLVYKQVQPQKA